MAALRHYYTRLGRLIWDVYGFRDGYNLSQGWVAPIYMGPNQAQIVIMIENDRSGPVPRWAASPILQTSPKPSAALDTAQETPSASAPASAHR